MEENNKAEGLVQLNADDIDKNSPSMSNILQNKTLKWVFVGGKGGVGKTTCSCSLALQLSQVRESVLLISTDPAHNVSDAFGQKFSRNPSKVEGYENLFAMEMDPKGYLDSLPDTLCDGISATVKTALNDFLSNIPGIDETLAYAEIMKMAHSSEYSVVVFDTAPTGHTLRLLSFPDALESFFTKAVDLRDRFTPFLNILQSFDESDSEIGNVSDMLGHFEGILEFIKTANQQLKNPSLTTVVSVCTPDFLSVYETERLIQQLSSYNMNCNNLVVNQLMNNENDDCKTCKNRLVNQKKYLDQIKDLYEDFHITQVPLVENEVRGTANLTEFSKLLIN